MTSSYLGVPVHGIIRENDAFRITQKPVEELSPLMQAVLDDPNIVFFGWHQYTPYFNDGDPCIFGVGEMYAVPLGENTDDVGEGYWSWQEKYGSIGPYNTFWETYAQICPDTYARVLALADAIESGAFNAALLELFGDHAEITVRKDEITIEEYSHN